MGKAKVTNTTLRDVIAKIDLMRNSNYSWGDIGKVGDIAKGTVYNIYHGNCLPSPEFCRKILAHDASVGISEYAVVRIPPGTTVKAIKNKADKPRNYWRPCLSAELKERTGNMSNAELEALINKAIRGTQ